MAGGPPDSVDDPIEHARFGFRPLSDYRPEGGRFAIVGTATLLGIGVLVGIYTLVETVYAKGLADSRHGLGPLPGSTAFAVFHPLRAALFFAGAAVVLVVSLAGLVAISIPRWINLRIPFTIRRLTVQFGAVGILLFPFFMLASVLYSTYGPNGDWILLIIGSGSHAVAQRTTSLAANELILAGVPLVIGLLTAGRVLTSDTYRLRQWGLVSIPVMVASVVAIAGSGLTANAHSVPIASSSLRLSSVFWAGDGFTTVGARSTGEPMLAPITSCAGSSCIAIATTVGTGFFTNLQTSHDGGRTWSGTKISRVGCVKLGGCEIVNQLDCIDQTRCVAASIPFPGIFSTSDGGRHWILGTLPQPVRASQGLISSLSCPSTTTCFAVFTRWNYSPPSTGHPSSQILVSTDGGLHWNSTWDAPGTRLVGLSCESSTRCTVVGQDDPANGAHGIALSSVDGGATWSRGSLPPRTGLLSGVTCPSPETCYAWPNVETATVKTPMPVVATHDGGATWQAIVPPTPFLGPLTMTCMDSNDCMLIARISRPSYFPPLQGYDLASTFVTDDAGVTWIQQPSRPELPSLKIPAGGNISYHPAIACSETWHCMVAVVDNSDNEGHVLTTSDGGGTWSKQSFAPVGAGIVNDTPLAYPTLYGFEGLVDWSVNGGH